MRTLLLVVFGMAAATTLTAAGTAAGQTYLLEGQILSGTALFGPGAASPDLEVIATSATSDPVGGFPVPYNAVLKLDPDSKFWTFTFAATDDVATHLFAVEGPTAESPGTQTDPVASAAQLELDFSRTTTIGTEFELDVDLSTGLGQWTWVEHCPLCFQSNDLPSAAATVTAVRVVPEPSSLLFALALLPIAAGSTCRKGPASAAGAA